MITWMKIGKAVSAEGSTIIYAGLNTNLYIESRKRHVPHANGIGTWDHTVYVVLKGEKELVTKNSLRDAKEYAEEVK
jgi:hypothetical protein